MWSQVFRIIMLKASFFDCFMQCNCLVKEIYLHDDLILFVCQHCFLNFIFCITMSSHSWCAACTQSDHECINLFWESLNCICAKLFSESVVVKEKQTWLFVKIIHLQKILNQLQNHAEQKILCLAEELADDIDEIENKNENEILFSTSQLINSLSLFFWESIFVSSQNIEVFLHSS